MDEHALPVPAAVLDMLRRHKGACSIAGVGAIGTWKVKLEPEARQRQAHRRTCGQVYNPVFSFPRTGECRVLDLTPPG